MKTQLLNYRVLIEKEHQPDGSDMFVSYVPVLGISDCGSTVEETMTHTQTAIQLFVESLLAHQSVVPSNSNTFFYLGQSQINVPLLRERPVKKS